MIRTETMTEGLHGIWRDVVRAPDGRVTWDSGVRNNAIVFNCRNLLAAFMGSQPPALGIQGLAVGAGLAAWDQSNAPTAQPSQTALVDPYFYTMQRVDLDVAFLNGAAVSASPTNKLQIVARLGPNLPAWPDARHSTSSLREFGLMGSLNGAPVLLNYVTHPVINKDPASTLERTIWLVF